MAGRQISQRGAQPWRRKFPRGQIGPEMIHLRTCAVLTALVVSVAAACGVPTPTDILSGPTINPADPQLLAIRNASHLEPCPAPEGVNEGLPPVTLPCLGGGRRVPLDRLKGPVIINFFQGFCEPCKKEMPALEEFYKRYGSSVRVVGIDTLDTIPGVALKEAVQRGVTFPLLADLNGLLQRTPLAVAHVPTTWALDSSGHVHFIQAGGMRNADEIVALLASRANINARTFSSH